MTINLTGVAILAGLSILVALPVHAQPNRPGSAKPHTTGTAKPTKTARAAKSPKE